MSVSASSTTEEDCRPHRGLFRSFAYVFVTRILAIVFGFAVSIIVARWYGTVATGLVALVNSSTLVFGAFAVLGQNTYLVRELALHSPDGKDVRNRQLYQRSLTLVLVASFVFAGPVAFILVQSFPDPVWSSSSIAIGIVGLALVGRSFVEFTVNTSRALAPVPVFCAFLIMPFTLNLGIVSIWGSVANTAVLVPSAALAIGLSFAGLAAATDSMIRLRRRPAAPAVSPPPPSSSNLVPSIPVLLKSGLPFLIASSSTVLLTEGNIIAAGLFLPASDIGVYSIAHRTSNLAVFALTSVSLIAQPELARRRSGESGELRRYARQISDLIFWATVPIVAFLFLARDWLIGTAFGPDFERAPSLMVILLAGHAVAGLTGATNPYLTMTGGQTALAKMTFFAACLSIVLTMALTPHFGLWGPAIAASAALTMLNIATLVTIRLRDGFWLCRLPRFSLVGKQATSRARGGR